MKWAMRLETDAVLTNDPEKYLSLRDHVPTEKDEPANWPYRSLLTLYFWSWLGFLMMSVRVWRFSGRGGWKGKLENIHKS
jgi:hypothetical protein